MKINELLIRVFPACVLMAVSSAVLADEDSMHSLTAPQSTGAVNEVLPQTMNQLAVTSRIADSRFITMDGQPLTKEETDSIREVMEEFYYDQFHHFDDPDAPYFMFMSRTAQLSLGIGGRLKVQGWYEWGGAVPDNGLVPYLIPIPENPAATRHLGVNVGGSKIFFRLIGRNSKIGLYQVYIEGGFSGYKNQDFKLKKGYATIRDFTVGYASSTFSDPSTLAPDVDAQGSTSQFDLTRVLVRYMPTFRKHYTVAISAEYPKSTAIQSNPNVESTDVWMPDIAAFLQYSWLKGSHVRLSGVVRTMGYRNLVTQHNHNVTGWGTQLSATGSIGNRLTLYTQLNYGHGMAGLTQDLGSGNYDLVVDPDAEAGTVYAPASWGWSFGAQCYVTPQWFFSAQASQTRYLPKHIVDPTDYKYGLYAAVNSYYNITPRITVAAQFTWGQRHNFNGDHRAARRIEALAQFSF